jgi:hypothetical protein
MNNAQNKGKFEPRATEGVFMGYSEVSKAYRNWSLSQKKIISGDVKVLKTLSALSDNNLDYNKYR